MMGMDSQYNESEAVEPNYQNSVYTQNEPIEEVEDTFYSNLALDMDEDVLDSLAIRLITDVQGDLDARQEWENSINIAMNYLGLKIEESRTVPFVNACSAYDSTLATALMRAYATARSELFPSEGPCKAKIIGIPTTEIEETGERVKTFMNHYLTNVDRDYYPDSELLLMYTIFFGSAFRQVYQDPILKRPIARTIKPQDFIVNPNTTSLLSSDRMTKCMDLSRKDIILREISGDFKKYTYSKVGDNEEEKSTISKNIELNEGITTGDREYNSIYKFLEVNVYLDDEDLEKFKMEEIGNEDEDEYENEESQYGLLDDLDYKEEAHEEKSENIDISTKAIPKPYVITIRESKKKIVSIKRNWNKGDKTYERKEHFVAWCYLKGFGIYGLGLAHLMGSNAVALTTILRQELDAGSLKNFPGGLKSKSLRADDNNIAVPLGGFVEVETNGEPIANHIMIMPYGEPSQVLMELRKELISQCSILAATAETAIPEATNNAPVGTTLALLEVNSKVQSAVNRSFNVSLGNELTLLYNLFGENLSDEPYPFEVPGNQMSIMRKDFNDKIHIVPVSDPNVLTSTHRLIRNQALMQIASASPQLYNMREVNLRMLQAMNVEQVDKILIPENKEVALDAISENIKAMAGKPITSAPFQDHDAHIMLHLKDAPQMIQMQNIPAYMTLMENVQEHKAYRALNDIKNEIQQVTSNPEVIQNPEVVRKVQERMMMVQQLSQMQAKDLLNVPEIQNMISKRDAEEFKQQQELAAQQPKPLDPNQVMMADIEQRREASQLKNQESMQKIEVDSYKAQLGFEGVKLKTDTDRDLSTEKNEVEMAIAEMKLSDSKARSEIKRGNI